jgi:hypothetical protein
MQIIDFCKDYDETLWQETLEIINASDDYLKENYLTLTPKDFICWTVLVNNNKIVCFSGLQENKERWGSQFSRINSRFYIAPAYRHNWPGKFVETDKFLNTRHLLPVQIKDAKELGFKGIFMSREGNHKKAFELYADLAYRNTGYYFEVLDNQYNVCGNLTPIPESCKQWVAVHCFDGNTDLWLNGMNQHCL